MDIPSMTWLRELEMEGNQQTHPYYSESVDLFSSESFKGCPNAVTTSQSFHVATTNNDENKPQEQTAIVSRHVPSQASSPNTFSISFGNPTLPQEINHLNGRSKLNYLNVIMPEDETSLNELLMSNIDGTLRSRSKRSHRQLQEHVLAERKRREKLAERFLALYALLPGLKKMDKITVLEEAKNYIIQLQTRVNELEETSVKGKDIIHDPGSSIGISKFCDVHEDVACFTHDTNYVPSSTTFGLEIKARISGSKMLVRIYCMNSSSILVKTLTEMERLRITVKCCSVLPFDTAHLITLIAQMSDEMVITAKYLVNCLLSTLKSFH